MKVLLFEAECVHLIQSCIDKLAILFVDYIVIQYDLVSSLCLFNSIRFLLHDYIPLHVSHAAEADADQALVLDEVHLVNLVAFLCNYPVLVCILEPARDQALGDVVEH